MYFTTILKNEGDRVLKKKPNLWELTTSQTPHHKPHEKSWTPGRSEDPRGDEAVNPGQAGGSNPHLQTPQRSLGREDSLGQLGSEAPVPAVVSHQELLKLIQVLSSLVDVKKLKKQNKSAHEDEVEAASLARC